MATQPQHSCLGNPMDRGAWCVHGVMRVKHDLVIKQQHYYYTYNKNMIYTILHIR